MTLKDLAKKLGKSTSELSRILGKAGFRGIYKESHTVPSEAIPLVEATLLNSDQPTPTALPSANPEAINQPEEKAPIQQQPTADGNKLQQVAKASVAVKTQINNQRHSQLNDDYEKVGAIDALTAQMSYRKGFDQTYQLIAEMDDKAHRQMMADIQAKLDGEIDFFSEQVNQNYYKSLQHTETSTAKDLQDMIANLTY